MWFHCFDGLLVRVERGYGEEKFGGVEGLSSVSGFEPKWAAPHRG